MESKSSLPEKVGVAVLATSLIFSFILLTSLWLFLDQPNHRVGGIAWNALIQALGAPIAIIYAIVIFVGTLAGKISGKAGIVSALFLGAAACYCLYQSFQIMMSV